MSTPSKNKRLILISILLLLIMAVMLTLNHNALLNTVGPNPSEIYKSANEYDTIEKRFVKQDTIKVDLDGLKNDSILLQDEIFKTISSELNGSNWNEEFQEEDLCTLYHETIFAKEFSSGNNPTKKLIVITFSNYVGNLYHAAKGRISLFEFQKENQSWQMNRKCLAFGYGTEYGLEPLWCKLHIGSKNKYAIIVQTDYSGNGGHDMQTQAVYTWIDNSLKLVFDFTNYEYYYNYPEDIEYTDGYSDMRILKSNKTWFDIETKSEESKWNDNSPGAVKLFKFVGKEYVEAK
jgi:hypothetical protein